ncbi:hypothetical protein M422DRAFT_780141 [Sphaerobolus stellatus SS14]|uniref:Uncharacterized protein n=1 Tax=Sphaerobolus stellatus (strain SS14) TaxID=990650 RepID=A0A0C9VUJ1_SPHS4|nr:hypothetical protein M422DRAFT_780141 [Sphaerobolus stellatus SS14]
MHKCAQFGCDGVSLRAGPISHAGSRSCSVVVFVFASLPPCHRVCCEWIVRPAPADPLFNHPAPLHRRRPQTAHAVSVQNPPRVNSRKGRENREALSAVCQGEGGSSSRGEESGADGGQVVGAIEGTQAGIGGQGQRSMSLDSTMGMASRATSLAPMPETSATMPNPTSLLGATERAALLSVEKGGLSTSSTSAGATATAVTANMGPKGYGLAGFKKSATQDKGGGGGDDESDEEWSSDGSESDVWDEEAEKSWVDEGNAMASSHSTMVKEGAAERQLYPIALPAKDEPLRLIARLSMEEAEEIVFNPSSSAFQDSTQDSKPFKKCRSPSSQQHQRDRSSSSPGSSRSSIPYEPFVSFNILHYAKHLAATSLINGIKSVEMTQMYFLMSVYGLPACRWEEDRSWFYGRLAGRIATDLNLNLMSTSSTNSSTSTTTQGTISTKPPNWSSAVQFGKPARLEDEAVKEAKEWENNNKHQGGENKHKEGEAKGRGDKFDVHLVAFTELLKVMSRFHESVGGAGIKDAADWSYEHESHKNDPGCVFRAKGLPLFENYMCLVMYSFGFEDAWKRHKGSGAELGDIIFFDKCLQSATAVVKQLCDVYAPRGYLKYAPDCYFVMGGFSAAFMLKVNTLPEFSSLLYPTQHERIISLVQRFVEMLVSPVASIDETHTPMLYVKLLHGQVKHVLAPEKEAQVNAESVVHTPDLTQWDFAAFMSSSENAGANTDGWSTSEADRARRRYGGVPVANGYEYSYNGVGGVEGGQGQDNMELCEGDYLATMQAVSNKQWMNTLLIPDF